MNMKSFGFLSFGHYGGPGSGHDAADMLTQAVELSVAADEIGVNGAYFRVHHFARQAASPMPLLSAIAARTKRIEVGTGVIDMRYRDVVYPEGHPKAGKSISGKVKLSDYQTAMREFMIERGWPVEAEIDKANEGFYLGKKNYARADNNRIIAEDRLAAAREQEDQNLDNLDLIAASRKKDAARAADLDAREADLDAREQEIADDRLVAQNARHEAEFANAASQAERARLRALREDVEGTSPPLAPRRSRRATTTCGPSSSVSSRQS